jgi:hypothetical protein
MEQESDQKCLKKCWIHENVLSEICEFP